MLTAGLNRSLRFWGDLPKLPSPQSWCQSLSAIIWGRSTKFHVQLCHLLGVRPREISSFSNSLLEGWNP